MRHIMHYAIEYAYGRTVANGWPTAPHTQGGGRADVVLRFPSRKERDSWVDEGPDNYTAGGYREALGSTSLTVRRAHSTPHYWDLQELGV